jgi:hypothetical protein
MNSVDATRGKQFWLPPDRGAAKFRFYPAGKPVWIKLHRLAKIRR